MIKFVVLLPLFTIWPIFKHKSNFSIYIVINYDTQSKFNDKLKYHLRFNQNTLRQRRRRIHFVCSSHGTAPFNLFEQFLFHVSIQKTEKKSGKQIQQFIWLMHNNTKQQNHIFRPTVESKFRCDEFSNEIISNGQNQPKKIALRLNHRFRILWYSFSFLSFFFLSFFFFVRCFHLGTQTLLNTSARYVCCFFSFLFCRRFLWGFCYRCDFIHIFFVCMCMCVRVFFRSSICLCVPRCCFFSVCITIHF